MNIIQSYFQLEKNTSSHRVNKDNYLLNFYSLLLSYLTINKFYGGVTMYCNQFAYDEMVKYIPYTKIIKNEFSYITPKNYSSEWGLYKFNIFQQQKKPFIHIDCDVFFFRDILSDYIKSRNYDGIVQSIDVDNISRIYDVFYLTNKTALTKYGFINPHFAASSYDKYNVVLGYNNGVVGFKNMDFLGKYIYQAKLMNDFINKKIFYNAKHQTIIFEQFNLFYLVNKYNINMYELLPREDVIKLGYNETGNKYGYTHLLSGNKYVKEFIMLVRDRIFKDYPKYKDVVREFEKKLLEKDIQFVIQSNVKKYM